MTTPKPHKFVKHKDVFRRYQSKHVKRPVYTLGRKVQVVPRELVSLVDGKISAKEIPGEAHFIFDIGQNNNGYRRHHIISNGECYYNVTWKYDYEQGIGSWEIDSESRHWYLDTEYQKLIKHAIQTELKNG